jgi:NAD(P)H-nitrite reductase large subunit
MPNLPKYVCECKSVRLNEILRSIRKYNCSSLLDIQYQTKASTGCGRCKNQVQEILNSELEKKNKVGRQLKLDF